MRRFLTRACAILTPARSTRTRVFVGAQVWLTCAACAGHNIAGSQVKDTRENREIIEVIEAYRRAAEQRDVDAVLALVARDTYYEDGGTPNTNDDYGYSGLEARLREYFKITKQLHLTISVQNVTRKENQVEADHHYTLRYEVDLPTGSTWKTTEDDDRFVLTHDKASGRWFFVAGL